MSRLDELPPDQRAALSLLLHQRKSYAEVAAMLGIAEQAVHDRAHAALAVLAPRQARELSPERRDEVGDYLLDQQPGVAERLRTRTYLSASEPARAWAQAVASELAPLAGAALPEIPLAGAAGALPDAVPAKPPTALDDRAPATAPADGAPPRGEHARALPSSRVGGAVLLLAIVAAVVVAIVLLSGGSSSKGRGNTSSARAGTTASGTSSGPTIGAKLPLRSPNPASRSIGLVQLLSEGSKRAFYLVAEHMPATHGFFYALWLYNSASSHEPLGKAPPVGSNHRLEGGGLLPGDAATFHEILLTRETSTNATHPGPIVLRGPFNLG